MKTEIVMTFQEATEATPDVKNGFCQGIQALDKKYRPKIHIINHSLLEGSVDTGTCTTELYPNNNRWDYALAYNQKVYFMEFHTAQTHEIKVVQKKYQWLKKWLAEKAPKINNLKKAQPAFYWIQSDKFSIPKIAPQWKQIAQSELKPVPKLELK